MLKTYIHERKVVYGSDSMLRDEKTERASLLKEQLIENMENETIGFSTLYRLLSSIEDQDHSQIKHVLLEILFLCGNKSFRKAILQSCSEVAELEEPGDDLELFGMGYKITKKQIKGEINA